MKVPVVNPELCTGCKVCEIICSLVKSGFCFPNLSRIKVVKLDKEGFSIPLLCMQCADPPCRDACPVEAISKDPETGAISINDEICNGCRACMSVCPYGAISMDIERKVAVTCDICGGSPECVKWCTTNAIEFVEEKRVDRTIRRAIAEKMTRLILKSRE